jgi:multisubunit Na+/H+ antiporter MnhB subunit
MKLQEKTKREIPSRLIAAAVIAAAIALGCIISGDNPQRFILRLFTLDYIPSPETGASLVTVALFGFMISFHRTGMCGGIISQCAGHKRVGIKRGFAYNIGHIISILPQA